MTTRRAYRIVEEEEEVFEGLAEPERLHLVPVLHFHLCSSLGRAGANERYKTSRAMLAALLPCKHRANVLHSCHPLTSRTSSTAA